MVYTKIQIKRMISIVVLLYCSCLVFAAVSSTMYNYPTYLYMDNQFESLSKAFNEMNIDPIHSYYKILGYSYRRNPISVLCFGSCKDEQTPSVYFVGGIHGREGIAVLTPFLFVNTLYSLLKDGDQEIQYLLSTRRVFVTFSMNPDAYIDNIQIRNITEKTYGLLRKNRRRTCAKRAKLRGTLLSENEGVDLNRNFNSSFEYDNKGSSPSGCAEDFRGEQPFSEPETQVIRDFLLQNKMNIVLNIHSYGKTLLLPYMNKYKEITDSMDKHNILSIATSVMEVAPGKYMKGRPHQLPGLYSVNGDASDWMYEATGAYAFGIELGPEYPYPHGDPFWPKNPLPLYNETYPIYKKFVQVVATSYTIKNITSTKKDSATKISFSVSNEGLVNGTSSIHVFGCQKSMNQLSSCSSTTIDPLPSTYLHSTSVEFEYQPSNATDQSPSNYYLFLYDASMCQLYSYDQKTIHPLYVASLSSCCQFSLYRVNSLISTCSLPESQQSSPTITNLQKDPALFSSLIREHFLIDFHSLFYRFICLTLFFGIGLFFLYKKQFQKSDVHLV